MLFDGPLLGGRYRLGPVLGHGGMSVVHRARDLATDTDVALKVFTSSVTADARARQSREVTLSRGLAHPAIAAVIDHSEDEPAYLVSELVDGPTLRTRISESPLPPDQVAVLGARLAGALAYLHEHGIVHRDIKPANVLLPGSDDAALGAAKLADFGVAIRIEDTRVTVDGNVVGTATYLSPEQVTGTEITSATDVYALGLLLTECLTGEPSFSGSGVECALARLHREPLIPADLPPGLTLLLQEMTAREPGDRPSAAQVRDALREGVPAVPSATAVLPELVDAVAAATPVAARPDEVTEVLPLVIDPAVRRRTLIRRGVAAGAGVAALGLIVAMVQGSGLPVPPPPSLTPTKPVVVHIPSTSPTTSPHVQVVAKTSHPAPAPQKPAPKKLAHGPGHGGHGPGHGGPAPG